MTEQRKTRSDAKLKNLPPDPYEALADGLLSGTPYRAVKQRLGDEFGVTTSNGALSSFWQDCPTDPCTLAFRAVGGALPPYGPAAR